MSVWGLNVYLYAPKDDDKHRAYWRDLYTLEEANTLSLLIQECRDRGVLFIYAIAPGLDITFSSCEDVTLLKRKLDQVISRVHAHHLVNSLGTDISIHYCSYLSSLVELITYPIVEL